MGNNEAGDLPDSVLAADSLTEECVEDLDDCIIYCGDGTEDEGGMEEESFSPPRSSLTIHSMVINQEPQQLDDGVYDQDMGDPSTHVFLISQHLTIEGKLQSTYYCPVCRKDYNSISQFSVEHPGVIADDDGAFEIHPVEEENNNTSSQLNSDESEETIMFDPTIIESNGECLYFCNKCHQTCKDPTEDTKHVCAAKKTEDVSSTAGDANEGVVGSEEKDPTKSLKYLCIHCGEIFNSQEDRVLHAGKCSNAEQQNVFYCPICDKQHINKRSFKIHVRKCNLSKLKTKNRSRRIKIIPPKIPETVCNICNTTFPLERNLKKHMKIHNRPDVVRTIQEALPAGVQGEYEELETFYCEICEKSFSKNHLNIHKHMHINVGDRNCRKCNRVFENISNYIIHLQMHFINNKIFRHDKFINKNNNSDELLKDDNSVQEVLADSEERPTKNTVTYDCQYCGKKFRRPYLKVLHERVHSGERPYVCQICGKSFRVCYSLTLHLRTHTDIRPFVCMQCDKRFKTRSVYRHHLNTHNVEKKFKCDQCDKSFRTAIQLSCHKNGHNKPFPCNICNRMFRSMSAVRSHLHTHSKPITTFKCHVCGMYFQRTLDLHTHIREAHNLNINIQALRRRIRKAIQEKTNL